MALIKTRPRIELAVPGRCLAGQRCRVEVRLTARRPVPLERLTLGLEGYERVVVGSGQQAQVHRRSLVSLAAELARDHELPAGSSSFPCELPLPPDLPPSYDGRSARVEYVIDVQAAIPWWPDARRQFVLVVSPTPSRAESDGYRVHTTSVQGPRGKEPHLEFSLSSERVLPGETLRGEVALSNVAHNRYKLVVLSVAGYERRRSAAGHALGAIEARRYSVRLPVSGAGEADPVPFAMRLPDELFPGFEAQLFDLFWSFEVEAEIAWAKNLSAAVPLQVLPRGSTKAAPDQLAPPTVGSARLARLWREVARDHGLSLDEGSRTLDGQVGSTRVRIGRTHRGAEGIFLRAELAYPSLGLDLDGGVVTGLRRVIGGGVELGHADWDRRHYIGGREPPQIRALLEGMADELTRVTLADIDDEQAIVEVRSAGQTRAALDGFVSDALALARALHRARARVPAPACMAAAEASWRRLAGQLGGRLDPGAMRIAGRLEGSAVEVATRWSPKGDATHTELVLAMADGVHERHRITWSDGRFIDGSPEKLEGAVQKRVEYLLDGARSLRIADDRIVLWDPAPLEDAAFIRERLDRMCDLAAALRSNQGPYR